MLTNQNRKYYGLILIVWEKICWTTLSRTTITSPSHNFLICPSTTPITIFTIFIHNNFWCWFSQCIWFISVTFNPFSEVLCPLCHITVVALKLVIYIFSFTSPPPSLRSKLLTLIELTCLWPHASAPDLLHLSQVLLQFQQHDIKWPPLNKDHSQFSSRFIWVG